MSKIQTLRGFINQRLSAAAEEIFQLFERTIAEYEEQLCRSKEDQHKHLDTEVRLHRPDDQQQLVSEDEVCPEQQETSHFSDQEDPSEPPHIKEEQEELWTNLEREQLHALKEDDIIKFTFTPVPVKSERDEEPESSGSHQTQMKENRDAECLEREADRERCGGSDTDRHLNSESHLQPVTDEEMSHFDSETDDNSCDWKEPQLGVNHLQKNEAPVSEIEINTGESSVSFLAHASSFELKEPPKQGTQGEKPFVCPVCCKSYPDKRCLRKHMKRHSEDKRFSCSFCAKRFPFRGELAAHMRAHTGEKPFSCHECGVGFTRKPSLTTHLRIHTGVKPFPCSFCKASFGQKGDLVRHTRLHTGEKPYSCSSCGKKFVDRGNLTKHLRVHTGEKPFSCNLCERSFTRLVGVKNHKCVGESRWHK